MMEKEILSSTYGTFNYDLILKIISLYYNGLSERTLNKKFSKKSVDAALHDPEYTAARKHMQEEKREAFENYWKQEGIPRLRGDAE